MTTETPTTLQKITTQISFAIGGRQAGICPTCNKNMAFRVGGIRKINGRKTRSIDGTCRHCRTSYSYIWK